MLRDILKQLKMLWIVLHALRTGLSGAVLVFAAALIIVPANNEESRILAQDPSDIALETLVMQRMATLMVRADSDTLYTAIAERAPENMSAWQIRFVAERLADGSMQIGPDGQAIIALPNQSPQHQTSSRPLVQSLVPPTPPEGLLAPRTNSAKFVSARTN